MEVIYKHKRADMPQIAPQYADYRELLLRLLAKSRRQVPVGARIARGDLGVQDSGVSAAPFLSRTPVAGGDPGRVGAGGLRVAGRALDRSRQLRKESRLDRPCPDVRLRRGSELTDKMSRLAREELRHYEQVAKLFPRSEWRRGGWLRAATRWACAAWSLRLNRSGRWT